MSFRKKNVVLGPPAGGQPGGSRIVPKQEKTLPPGTRPSPLDGRLTISTGTASLDQYLAGHAGLPLGCSVLVEESGTTDFSGVLLKYYAAEGLVQGHHVHLLGPGEAWRTELPGLGKESSSKASKASTPSSGDKMKIAWRYETLNRNTGKPESDLQDTAMGNTSPSGELFRHTFDLAARLDSKDVKGQLHAASSMAQPGRQPGSPLHAFIAMLDKQLSQSPPDAIHRVIVPSLLAPTMYGPSACRPSEVLQFLHGLRGLLRRYSSKLSAIISLSTVLYPRPTGLTRVMEILSDGVLEMVPLQQPVHTQPNAKPKDAFQGMLRVHRLPVYHERGGGREGKSSQESLSFKLSSSNGIVIKPFSLPPVGEVEGPEKAETKKKEEGLAF